MRHRASADFWKLYNSVPEATRSTADRAFKLLKDDSTHPSLHFKKVGPYRSARVGIRYRVLAVETEDGLLWFWIGSHAEYDAIIG